MAYINSSLVSYTKLSPNCTKPRNHAIDTITPHCVVGQLTAKATLNLSHFVNYDPNGGASCNYAIGTSGEVGMGVEEANRSWCTSSKSNDHRAITIECASDTKHPYAMNTAVYAALVNLCVDICKRNGKKKLLWLGDKDKTLAYNPKSDEMVLTAHRWFANKACPGDWLYSRFGNLATEVTEKLGGSAVTTTEPTAPTTTGTLYRVRKSWADAKNQLGAYKVLKNAQAQVDKNPGYYVFDESGKVVYPTTTSNNTVPTPTTVANADKVIWDALKGKGLNAFAIAGIMGNLYAESALKPTNLQNTYEKSLGYTDDAYTAAVDNGSYTNFVKDSAGYGLAQWTYWSRKQNLLNYAKSVGKSIGDLNMQIEFLWNELQGYKTVMTVLKSAKSIKEASDIVLTEFERPANTGDSVKTARASYGQKYYDKFASASDVVVTEPAKPDTDKTENITPTKEQKATDYAQNFNDNFKGKYKVTAKGGLNLRHGAGMNKAILCAMPYGTVVQNFGYYTNYSGVSWLYVVATVNGVRYTGFCSKAYLAKT